MDHDYSSRGIEGQGQRSRLGLELGSQFETRSMGPRFSSEDSFLVLFDFDVKPVIFTMIFAVYLCPLSRLHSVNFFFKQILRSVHIAYLMSSELN